MKRPGFREAVGAGVVILSAACARVATVPLDADSARFYETARLIMSGPERSIFNHLPDAGARREFIGEFWAKRDPDPETAENEFYDEFVRRIEYCNHRFIEGKKGINTDRGRVYLQLGPPEKEDAYTSPNGVTTLYWSYFTYALAIKFIEDRPGLGFEIKEISGNLFRAIEYAQFNAFGSGPGGARDGLFPFSAAYDAERKEIRISIPRKKIHFREESGELKVDLDFLIYIYRGGGAQKDRFEERRNVVGPAHEVEAVKDLTFVFPYELSKGRNDVDILIDGGPDNGRTRKIFTFKN